MRGARDLGAQPKESVVHVLAIVARDRGVLDVC